MLSFTDDEFRVEIAKLDSDELRLFTKIVELAITLQDLPEQSADSGAEWLLDVGQALIDDFFLDRSKTILVGAKNRQFVLSKAA